jgi:cell division protein FtsL
MAVAVARSRSSGRVRPRRRTAAHRRTAGGAVWIVLMGVLLAGVVALNVAVLRLNLEFDQLGRDRDKLRAESAELASELATRSASARTSSLARDRLGFVPADPATTTYLDLGGR